MKATPRFAAMCALLAAGGCATPDRWRSLQPDWDRVATGESYEEVVAPDPYLPRPDTPSVLPDLTGAGPVALSVEQAVLLALRGNLDLAVEQLTPVTVGAFEDIERGAYDPEAFAAASFSREQATETARSTGEQFDVEAEDSRAEAGLRQRIPTGTDIEVSVSHVRTTSNRTPEQQEARAGLTLTQSLLRGFGPAVNLAAVRQAELGTLASVYELRGFTEALVAETEIAYWYFVSSLQEITIFEESLDIARRQRDQIEQRIEVGDLAQTEAAAARVEVAIREQALINARSALESRRLQLLRRMNPDPAGSLDLDIATVTEPKLQPAPIDDVADRLEVARRMRPDLNEARLRHEQDRLETAVTRNGLLPHLDLFITLGSSGYADSFSVAVRNVNDEDTYDVTAGVTLSQALGNRTAEARDRAARASRRQSAIAVANLEQLVRLDVRLAVTEAERTRQQIAATAATRQLQEESVQAERQRFEVGTSTALLVAQAQRDLLVAQIDEVAAIVNYRIALVELYRAEGSLLERRGIRIDASEL